MVSNQTIIQRPIAPNTWLYKDFEWGRHFTDSVGLPEGAELWAECTDEEKEEWEREHPQPTPENAE